MEKTCMVSDMLHTRKEVVINGKRYCLPVEIDSFIWALMPNEKGEPCAVGFTVEDYAVIITERGHVTFSMPMVVYYGKCIEITSISLDSAFYRDETEARSFIKREG